MRNVEMLEAETQFPEILPLATLDDDLQDAAAAEGVQVLKA